MFDFRYHAASLAAVFLALAVGLLLGIAVGDRELVSSAREELEQSLEGDVREQRAQSARLRDELRRQDRFAGAVIPLLVRDELDGRRIGLVFLGEAQERVADLVRDGLEDTGAELAFAGALRLPPDRAQIAALARGTRYAALATEDDLLEPFAFRMGVQLGLGGRLVERVRPALLQSFSGSLRRIDGLVVVRGEPEEGDDASAAARAIAEGAAASGVPAVGVELAGTQPSNVDWYRDRGLSSVDSLDQVAGRAALVFALQGAEGAFGFKPSAQALLPPLASRDP
ncbi:copper transporter [Conexibacter sp. SYSU D00693]|uniref:copper transporter n=1 Tax=Conexibacter sp. SYSU D00693 TaxID=2812560 RepID=UPI00196B78F3|nr:copper transporter [Conexibacter sp. SYSU D00693]